MTLAPSLSGLFCFTFSKYIGLFYRFRDITHRVIAGHAKLNFINLFN